MSGLPEHLVALLAAATAHLDEHVRSALLRQAAVAVLVSETPGRTADVAVPDDAPPVAVPDGYLRPVPEVVDAGGRSTGEVLVWVRSGRLVGLERPWWSDEAPDTWPGPDDLVLDADGGDLGASS